MFTSVSFVPSDVTVNVPRYGFLNTSGALAEDAVNVSGPVNVCASVASGSLNVSCGLSVTLPAGSVVAEAVPSFSFHGPVGRDRHARGVREQDADALDGRRAELGAGVVVRENLVVRVAVLRIAVRAPLAHSDAVAPTVADDEELRRPFQRRRREARRAIPGDEPGEQQEKNGCSTEDQDAAFRLAQVFPSLRNPDFQAIPSQTARVTRTVGRWNR